MKTICLIASVCVLFSCTPAKPQSSQKVVEGIAQELLEDERFHSTTIVVYKGGKSIIRHYGELTEGLGNTPTDSSLYDIASLTKTFTGTLTAKAVLDGKLKLEDDIRQFLEDDYPNLQYRGEKITIQHLLTHRGGFPNFAPRSENKKVFFTGLRHIEIAQKPGDVYQYSNMAPELMAFILEKVYGTPYHDLIRHHILQPNGMETTRFSLVGVNAENIVKGYDGERPVAKLTQNLWGGATGLHVTAPDLLKYMQWQLDSTNEVVQESHRKLGQSPYGFDLGYYWNIVEEEGQTICRHHGGTYGMQNWFMVYPKYNMGIAMLTNSSFEETGGILEGLIEQLYHHLKNEDL
ncbi:MAG: serine hydrolase domain-containing protein [Bacteroidota bacterium]